MARIGVRGRRLSIRGSPFRLFHLKSKKQEGLFAYTSAVGDFRFDHDRALVFASASIDQMIDAR